ncbi:hypothetical protein AAVH_12729 [Aphelenchoides avenae]|nr:hypothetical protein AAVH_12729 [Aphelenchus avenae]
MSAELSPHAIHRIIYFLENDDRRARQAKKAHAPPTKQHLRKVNEAWNYVHSRYFLHNRTPPMDYLRSLELALFVRKDLDSEAMRTVFAHGKPLVFDRDRPRLLVPAIIEAFQELKEEPSFLDVVLGSSSGTWNSDMALSAVWPRAYIDYVPCGARTATNGPGKANKEKPQEV